ncbi:MAG TPA: hypothetical protein VKC15_13740 [Gemmatimonadales bacterium]|nr:hypothetical protein [Gemmatimonadales bacterium]
MSFRVIVGARRFAIDGELNAAVTREKLQLRTSGSGGAGLATSGLGTLKTAVDELLSRAPHDCDVAVELSGGFAAEGTGYVKLKLEIRPHEVRSATEAILAAESATAAAEKDPSLAGSIGGDGVVPLEPAT